MSHIVEAKTAIKYPDASLLHQAAELVAGQHKGGHLEDHYLMYGGKEIKTPLALFTKTIHRGIGLVVNDMGELTFIGDPWGCEEEFEAAQNQLVQTYVSVATMQALQQMGYSASAEEDEEGQIILTGVNQYA